MIYKKLSKKCLSKSLNEKEICEKWLENKNINPKTSRKITEKGVIYKKLSKECSVKFDIPSETKKINAIKKIHKLFIPYIKRTSVNIIDRINYFLLIKKYILSIKEKNNCLRLYNINEKTKELIYRVGNKIILDKQIGTKSVYGIVFLSHFKSNIKYGTKFDRLNKFAVKITNQSASNKKEIEILKHLTKLVIELKCPHFPISYGNLKCNNSNKKSNNPDDYSIVKDKHKNKNLLPPFVINNNNIYIQINELAAGDLHSLLTQLKNPDILNIIANVLISLMFFHNYTNCYHGDPHTGNFLYHKIKPGGYFHYNIYGKDYYLENKGYLWVVWDFGLIKPFTPNNKFGATQLLVPINYDYKYILDALNWYNSKFTSDINLIKTVLYELIINKYNNVFNYNSLTIINKEILDFLIKNVSSLRTIKPSNVINKNPYIIR